MNEQLKKKILLKKVKALNSIKLEDRVSVMNNNKINLLTRTRTWTLSELFVCTCHCFQTDKVKQDKMNLDKLYIILKV